MTDAQAMSEIQTLLSASEWTPDTLEDVAQIMQRAGYKIEDKE